MGEFKLQHTHTKRFGAAQNHLKLFSSLFTYVIHALLADTKRWITFSSCSNSDISSGYCICTSARLNLMKSHWRDEKIELNGKFEQRKSLATTQSKKKHIHRNEKDTFGCLSREKNCIEAHNFELDLSKNAQTHTIYCLRRGMRWTGNRKERKRQYIQRKAEKPIECGWIEFYLLLIQMRGDFMCGRSGGWLMRWWLGPRWWCGGYVAPMSHVQRP